MFPARYLILLCLFCCGGIQDPGPSEPVVFVPGQKNLRILYIGNSLTYSNDLPAMVAELGLMDGVTISYKTIAPGGGSLEDHWNAGEAQAEMAAHDYDLVVGQQGPSALPESQVLLKQYAAKFAEECKKQKVPWSLYMVWPAESRIFDLDNVIYSYTQAAKATTATLFPAGLAWKYAWQIDPALPLYGDDRFHPSVVGSLLAAMTIYAVLQDKTDFDFIQHQSATWGSQVSSGQLLKLKQAAIKATEDI
jgi:hypothetical protein